ncbi:MAG: hypothetical protein GY930_09790 [bacterium]|nr:hypothetical protein [bacterium]
MIDHAGEWVTILGTQLLPPHKHEKPSPKKTLEELLADPSVTLNGCVHRFIFRIGEDGLIRYRPTMNNHTEWIGSAFFGQFKGTLWNTPEGVWVVPRSLG